jgi:MarR family 2-MHQ and catechol resistance regulon transcriptional repressor
METGAHIRLVLWKAHKAVEALDRASIAATGLGWSDFAVLEALLHKGPLPVNTLGKKVLLTSGSITTAVDRLEAQRLVLRKQDPDDGRVFHVHLTARGRRLIRGAFEAHAKRLDRLAGALSPSERIVLVHLLKKLGKRAAGSLSVG